MNAGQDHFKIGDDGAEYAGDHLLIELWGATRLDDLAHVQQTLERAATAAGATILHSHFHPFGEGQGVSGVTLLAESHVSIHTWPERGYAAVDAFMCGRCDPRLTVPAIETGFLPQRLETHLITRGHDGERTVRSVA